METATPTVPASKCPRHRCIRLITFEATPEQAGGFSARGAGVALFTRGKTMEDVWVNVREAVARHYSDRPGEYEVGTTFRLSHGYTTRLVDRVRVD